MRRLLLNVSSDSRRNDSSSKKLLLLEPVVVDERLLKLSSTSENPRHSQPLENNADRNSRSSREQLEIKRTVYFNPGAGAEIGWTSLLGTVEEEGQLVSPLRFDFALFCN